METLIERPGEDGVEAERGVRRQASPGLDAGELEIVLLAPDQELIQGATRTYGLGFLPALAACVVHITSREQNQQLNPNTLIRGSYPGN